MIAHSKYALGLTALCLLVANLGIANAGIATERSNEANALALIKEAQDYIKANGLERSYEEFNRLDSPFNSKSKINPVGISICTP